MYEDLEEHTKVGLKLLLCLDMIFLQFVVELLEGFKVLDSNTHFLDFLAQEYQ